MTNVSVVSAAETAYTRHPDPYVTTHSVLADAVRQAVSQAGLRLSDIDGFGVSSFTLGPDHAVDLAWRLGLRLTWLMQDTNGGASAGGMLQHAVRAVEAGDATAIVLVAGDRMDGPAFEELVRRYNVATEEHLSPLPMPGPNAAFAMLTQRQMQKHGLSRSDYGRIAVAQRGWAALNPGAVYRSPLALEDYLEAPMVADPLGRYDCVPPVTGADAVVVMADERAKGRKRARVLSVAASYNYDDQSGDGLVTGLAVCAPTAWHDSGVSPADVGVASLYDDYPSMVVAQAQDLGLFGDKSPVDFIRDDIMERNFPLNTSGGQLSAGQAGSAGGMHGLVEVVRQLSGQAGDRQVDARIGVVSGYGMVLYRYGACANVAVLEAAS
ncbi:thiolase family protein [Salinibacterium sp. GXW1014]|uniref:thiolase family protein n=1 Tax=Salinibacterium sp. GXW1014 TaxID=3377838 RepID=UPI00383A9C21